MALFEPEIDPDRISDMTTNIILGDIAKFNERAIKELGLVPERFVIGSHSHSFVANPYESKKSPLALVPTDVLRDLPVAQDWDGIADASAKNDHLRNTVAIHIGEIRSKKSKRDRAERKKKALSGHDAFQTLLAAISATPYICYPIDCDPEGLTKWASAALEAADKNPLRLAQPKVPSVDRFKKLPVNIVETACEELYAI